MLEPKVVAVVERHADHYGDHIVGAHLREGAGGISGGLHYDGALLLLSHPGADAEGLGLLERAGLELGPYGGIVAGESDVEIIQAQELAQTLAVICHRSAGTAQGTLNGHPLRIAVKTVKIVPGSEFLILIDGPHKGGSLSFRICQSPSAVFENAAGGDIHQFILGALEFHIGQVYRVMNNLVI